MTAHPRISLNIAGYEKIAETPDLRVSVLTLAAGERVPWHRHTRITDTFFCLEGVMEVQMRDPEGRIELQVGESCAVEPGRPHHAQGKQGGPCRYLLVQGVGTYDSVPLEP